MKRLIVFLFLLLIVPSICFSGMIIQKIAAGGACSGTFGFTGAPGGATGADDIIKCIKITNGTGCDESQTNTVVLSGYVANGATATKLKWAIYSDNADQQGTLLGSSAEFDPSSMDDTYHDETVTLSGGGLTNGQPYWICAWGDGDTGAIDIGRDAGGADNQGWYNYDYADNSGVFPATGAAMNEGGSDTFYLHCDISN